MLICNSCVCTFCSILKDFILFLYILYWKQAAVEIFLWSTFFSWEHCAFVFNIVAVFFLNLWEGFVFPLLLPACFSFTSSFLHFFLHCYPVFILCFICSFIFTICKPVCPQEGACLKVCDKFLCCAALLVNKIMPQLWHFTVFWMSNHVNKEHQSLSDCALVEFPVWLPECCLYLILFFFPVHFTGRDLAALTDMVRCSVFFKLWEQYKVEHTADVGIQVISSL